MPLQQPYHRLGHIYLSDREKDLSVVKITLEIVRAVALQMHTTDQDTLE